MNRKTYLILGVILLLSIMFPWCLFQLQDHFTLHRSYAMHNTTSSHDLMETYPIIAEIYADFYDDVSPGNKGGQYQLSELDSYDEQVQEKLRNRISTMEQAITDMVTANVLTPVILNQNSSQYEIHFGTLTAFSSTSKSCTLEQTFSIDGDHVRSSEFNYVTNSHKIIKARIYNEAISSISEKQQKEMAKAMISYLGLEDIDDWTATDHGYESYQAKLQINCDVNQYGIGYACLELSVSPLGQYRQINNYSITLG